MSTLLRQSLFMAFILISMGSPCFSEDVPCPYEVCNCRGNDINCRSLHLAKLPTIKSTATHTDGWSLDISFNNISVISDDELPHGMTEFQSSGNPLTSISEQSFIHSASSLHKITIESSHMTTLPSALYNLTHVYELTWSTNPTHAWNTTILTQLGQTVTTLTLRGLDLTTLPDWLELFPVINYLYLGNNELSDLSGFSSLNLSNALYRLHLDLSFNKIENISPLFNLNAPIRQLYLRSNQISDHTHILYALRPHQSTLTDLDLAGNSLTQIPDLLFMSKLSYLNLGDNQIVDSPMSSLPSSLTILYIYYNQLTSVPSSVSDMNKLQYLNLHSNNITSVDSVSFPSSLTILYLHNNKIKVLNSLTFKNNTSHLFELYLHSNPLTTINQTAFNNLRELSYLRLSSTHLTRLPLALKALINLEYLDLSSIPTLTCTCIESSLGTWYHSRSGLSVSGKCGDTTVSYFLDQLAGQCPAS